MNEHEKDLLRRHILLAGHDRRGLGVGVATLLYGLALRGYESLSEETVRENCLLLVRKGYLSERPTLSAGVPKYDITPEGIAYLDEHQYLG